MVSISSNWKAVELWSGSTAYIIGGGSSLNTTGLHPQGNLTAILEKMNEDLSCIKDKRVIGTNDAFLLGSWVDVCWFNDVRWFHWNRLKLLDFGGLKICNCPTLAHPPLPGLKVLGRSNQLGLSQKLDTVRVNMSSGAAAINLATIFGCKRIVLLGFDMYIGPHGVHNWHVNHLVSGHSPKDPYVRFLKAFGAIARDAKNMGVEIINCNKESKIPDFKKMSLEEAVSG